MKFVYLSSVMKNVNKSRLNFKNFSKNNTILKEDARSETEDARSKAEDTRSETEDTHSQETIHSKEETRS